MGEIVNLRQARKARARAAKEAEADANRVKHGTPKGLRDLGEARREKERRDIDAHKIEPD
jgi:hypothetical protein